MTGTSTAHRMRRRWVAAAALALCWTRMGLSLVHQASSTHGYCAEHGAVEELPPSLTVAVVDTEPARAADAAPVTANSHQDCAFVSTIPTDRARPATGSGPVTIPGTPLEPVAADETSLKPLDLLALAPKTSPPRA